MDAKILRAIYSRCDGEIDCILKMSDAYESIRRKIGLIEASKRRREQQLQREIAALDKEVAGIQDTCQHFSTHSTRETSYDDNDTVCDICGKCIDCGDYRRS